MESVRSFVFSLQEAQSEEGVVKVIGRASNRDQTRIAAHDNLFFDEKSLSKNHARLVLKLVAPLVSKSDVSDSFRIYVRDLGSSYGIVDLNSDGVDNGLIDLKNGEQFGLVQMGDGVKLKLQVNINSLDDSNSQFECVVKEMSSLEVEFFSDVHSSSSSLSVDGSQSCSIIDIIDGDSFDLNHVTTAVDIEIQYDDFFLDADSTKETQFEEVQTETFTMVELVSPTDSLKREQVEAEKDLLVSLTAPQDSGQEAIAPVLRRKRVRTQKDEDGTHTRKKFCEDSNRKAVLVSGFLGFLLGSLGTLSILIHIANNLEE